MIRRVVDFALGNRLLVVGIALLLFAWGIVSFERLPIEAYPDVADNYVEIITQWPGISAEQIEQQVTIPLETAMNGIPQIVHLRSFSLFGLSDIKLIFDDDSDNAWNRERVLERLAQVTLPTGVVPQMGTDWSPVGQIYFYTLHSSNPAYDAMELKSLEDWVVEKRFKAIPNIVDVASFGGPTREYQVRVDPNKLIAYGLSLAQVEQQLTNNNVNAGGSFIQEGLQQINVRSVGLVDRVQDIEQTVITSKNGTPIRVKDIAVVQQGPKIRLGQFARALHREDGKIVDNDDVVSGIVLLRKGAAADSALEDIHRTVDELNTQILPKGVTIVPFLDRSKLVHYTTHTVLHNLTEGMILVSLIPLLVPGQRSRRADRGGDHSILPALCRHLSRSEPHSCESPLARRSRFRRARGRRDRAGRKYCALAPSRAQWGQNARGKNQRLLRTRFSARSFTPLSLRSPPSCQSSRLQRVEGRLFRPMAWTVAFALLGALLFSIVVAPVLSSFAFAKGASEWRNPVMTWLLMRYRVAVRWAIHHRAITIGVCLFFVDRREFPGLHRHHWLRISAASR